MTGFAATQHYLWSRVWGGTNRRTEPVSETAFFCATLAALLAAKGFALMAVGEGRFDRLPRPTGSTDLGRRHAATPSRETQH